MKRLKLAAIAAFTMLYMVNCTKPSSEELTNEQLDIVLSGRTTAFDAGEVHNSMLDYFLSEIRADSINFFSGLDTSNFYSRVPAALLGYSMDYYNDNNFSTHLSSPGLTPTEISTLVSTIEDSTIAWRNSESVFDEASTDFTDAIAALQIAVSEHGFTSELDGVLDNVVGMYGELLTDSAEILAFEYGVSIGKASNAYWIEKIDNWNATCYPSLDGDARIMRKGPPDESTLWSDMIGGIKGAYRGAKIGATFGNGAGLAGGAIVGVVAGAASASGISYLWDRVKNFFW
jgi:hypothetical protein